MNLSIIAKLRLCAGANISASICHKLRETVDTFDPSASHTTGPSHKPRGMQLE